MTAEAAPSGAGSNPTSALIIGAGLIGSSIGLALREAGWEVFIEDESAQSTEIAVQATGLARFSGQVPDLVVVATPPSAVAEVVTKALRTYVSATVIDVASVKSDIALKVYAETDVSDRYVPTHPMAGKETSGAENAAYDLFADRLWVYSPSTSALESSIALVERAIKDARAVPLRLPLEEHDPTVALTSHLPQLVSSALAGLLAGESLEHVAVSGQGLRDMTRLAGSNPELWSEILLSNRDFVTQRLGELQERLDALRLGLLNRDESAIEQLLRIGNKGRERLPGKHGEAAEPWASVAIVIEDAPGQLAAIFNLAGSLDVNIEDVRIDHALGRAAAIIELDVRPEAQERLRSGLISAGWRVRSLPPR